MNLWIVVNRKKMKMSWFACLCGVNDDDALDDVNALQPVVNNPLLAPRIESAGETST